MSRKSLTSDSLLMKGEEGELKWGYKCFQLGHDQGVLDTHQLIITPKPACAEGASSGKPFK